MAVVTVKSAQITNRDTVPIVPQDAKLKNSELRGAMGVVTVTSGNDIASKYIACSVPAKGILRSLTLTSPDLGTTTIADVGLYRTTKNGGTVVDADFFTAAVSLKDGALVDSQVLNGNIITLALSETILKNHVGPATYPNDDEFDVVLTLTAAADATGQVLVKATFAEG